MCSSCCRNTSAQPYRGTHMYAHINEYRWTMRSLNRRGIHRWSAGSPHSQVCSSYKIGLLCSAHAALVRVLQIAFAHIVQKRVRMKMSLRSLIKTLLLEFVSAAVFWRNYMIVRRYRLPCAYNKYQNQTTLQIKLEFIKFTLFVSMCVCVHKSDAAKMQAKPSPEVINTCTKLHQFRSVN